MTKYVKLVVSGGGIRGLAILGALDFFDSIGELDNINEFWGVSAGSIIAFLLIIGYKPIQIFHNFFSEKPLIPSSGLTDITIGLISIETVSLNIKNILADKQPTFKEIYEKYGKTLNIIGTNVDKMECTVFNHLTFPDMSVIEAIEISCALPFVFTKKYFNGDYYIDGGLTNNYPIDLADNGFDEILGIYLKDDYSSDTTLSLLYKIMNIPIHELHKKRLKQVSEKVSNFELQINGINFIEFNANSKKKLELFGSGYAQAKTFCEKRISNGWPSDFDPGQDLWSGGILEEHI